MWSFACAVGVCHCGRGRRPITWVLERLAIAVLVSGACLLVSATGASAASPTFSQVSGSPFAFGETPFSVAFSPGGGLLATANYDTNTVSVFSVGGGGSLTQVAGSPFSTGQYSGPRSAVFSPDGRLLATANLGNSVSVFSVASDGTLTEVPGSPFQSGNEPSSVAFSPDGGLLATANTIDDTVSVFAVGSDGELTQVAGSPFSTGHLSQPVAVAFSPNGGLLATANDYGNSISVFTVDGRGVLSQVPASPFPVGREPNSVAFSPTGDLLAAASLGGDAVSVFSVAVGGALTPVQGSPFPVGGEATSVAFSRTGLLAVINAQYAMVSVFAVSPGGALTEVSGSPFPTGSGPMAAPDPDSVAFSPDGALLAVANDGGSTSVSILSVAPPSAAISGPSSGGFYALGQTVETAFSCADSVYGPGVDSCRDASGRLSPGVLETSTLGVHRYTVIAGSSDGQIQSASIAYTVAAAPSVAIGAPGNSADYQRGELVSARYSCQDGAYGPGISSCTGTVPVGALIDTSTPGPHAFQVAAVSKDGQRSTVTVRYEVTAPLTRPAVSHIHVHPDGVVEFALGVPGPGIINVLETAPRRDEDPTARDALHSSQPASQRFVFASARTVVTHHETVQVRVVPDARGRRLVRHHRRPVWIELWITYQPHGSHQVKIGPYGLLVTR